MSGWTEALEMGAPTIFASVLLVAVFFLIARLVRARQPIALAFGLTPLLLTSMIQHVMGGI